MTLLPPGSLQASFREDRWCVLVTCLEVTMNIHFKTIIRRRLGGSDFNNSFLSCCYCYATPKKLEGGSSPLGSPHGP